VVDRVARKRRRLSVLASSGGPYAPQCTASVRSAPLVERGAPADGGSAARRLKPSRHSGHGWQGHHPGRRRDEHPAPIGELADPSSPSNDDTHCLDLARQMLGSPRPSSPRSSSERKASSPLRADHVASDETATTDADHDAGPARPPVRARRQPQSAGSAPRPPNGSEFRGRGSNPAVAGTPYSRVINEDVGVDWPRATSMFRGAEGDERHVDVPKARPRRRSRAQGGRRKRERGQRGVRWLNATERADAAGSSRSRRRGGIGPDWSKIATGSPFPWTPLLGGREVPELRAPSWCYLAA